MIMLPYDPDKIQVKLAKSDEEIHAAQTLRYKVFYEEFGAIPNDEMRREKRDIDPFDSIADHLITIDKNRPRGDQVIGTYRLLRREAAETYGRFYTSDEFNIQPLLNSEKNLLELGRSCIIAEYRSKPVLQKLWEGIAHYVFDHNIGLMFGCASLHGTNIQQLSRQLAYLYHFHRAEDHLCPKALHDRYVNMNLHAKEDLDQKKTFMTLPPLMKGYLRLGGTIGDGAVIDEQFGTTDVCIVMPSSKLCDKYLKHYERKTQKTFKTVQNTSA